MGENMQSGFVLDSVKQHNKSNFRSAFILVIFSLLIISISYKRIYNSAKGPFPFVPGVVQGTGMEEFFRVAGPFTTTHLAQQTTSSLRLLRGVVESKSTDITAIYYLAKVGPDLVVIKAPKDFSGQAADGVPVPLPENVKQQLLIDMKSLGLEGSSLFPMMIDTTTGYMWDFNLFFWVALFFLAMGLLSAVRYLWSMAVPTRHPSYRYLATQGQASSVIKKLEQEVVVQGEKARIGPYYLTQNWLVQMDEDRPFFIAVRDWCGVTVVKSDDRKSDAKLKLRVFVKGVDDPLDTAASAQGCAAVILEIQKKMPWLIVLDAASFTSRWKKNRKSCIEEIQVAKHKFESA